MTTHVAATVAATTSTTATAKPDAFERIVPAQLADTLRRSFGHTPAASEAAAATTTTTTTTTTTQTTARPLIIDVRGDDYDASHIASAVHHPEPGFHDDALVDALVEQYKHEETIVFHCQLSQVRGPFCARRFLERLDVLLTDATDKKPVVQVLTDGYAGFSDQFQGDTELLEIGGTRASQASSGKPREQP